MSSEVDWRRKIVARYENDIEELSKAIELIKNGTIFVREGGPEGKPSQAEVDALIADVKRQIDLMEQAKAIANARVGN